MCIFQVLNYPMFPNFIIVILPQIGWWCMFLMANVSSRYFTPGEQANSVKCIGNFQKRNDFIMLNSNTMKS